MCIYVINESVFVCIYMSIEIISFVEKVTMLISIKSVNENLKQKC